MNRLVSKLWVPSVEERHHIDPERPDSQ
jgi:hypothetical protein